MSACADESDIAGDDSIRPVVQQVRLAERVGVQGDVKTASYRYMTDRRAALGMSADDDFSLISHRVGRGGFEHVRLQQTYRGVKVYTGDVVVHSARGTMRMANGSVVAGLGGLDVAPAISSADALAQAKADYAGHALAGAELGYAREASELVIYPKDKAVHLAWHVEFFTELQAGMEPGRWHYFIDARTGRQIDKFNWLHTLEQASGPGGNPNITRTWNMELDVEPSGTTYVMDTADLQTVNMNNSENGNGTVVSGALANIGDAAINDAHGFAEASLGMLTSLGYDSIDGMGFVIRSRVHYGTNYENAFWDGVQMTYGDGDVYFYPLAGDIDVVAHEIHHGFTQFHSNLNYQGMPGGLNESFSDIAGTATEYYHEGATADMDLGADILKSPIVPGLPGLRSMCDPTADGASIDHASDFTPSMDVHYSSGVSNKAFCLAANRYSTGTPTGPATPAGVLRAAQAWYEANANYWTSGTSFNQGCQGTIDAAIALGFTQAERDFLRDSWLDVGVYCDGNVPPLMCDTLYTDATGVVTSPNYPNNYPNNWTHTDCIDPPGGGIANFSFTNFSTEADYDFVELSDGTTGAQLSFTSGNTAPAPVSARIVVVRFTSDFSIVATGWRGVWNTTAGNEPPVASFTYAATYLDVLFTDTSTDADGTIAAWAWDLGDGNTSTMQNPAHTYAAAGTYTVALTVTDDVGDTNTATMMITVDAPPPPPDAMPPDAMPEPDAAPAEPDAGPSEPDAGVPTGPDAGVPPTDPGDGDCGCEVGGRERRTPWSALFLAFGAFVFWRRRRR